MYLKTTLILFLALVYLSNAQDDRLDTFFFFESLFQEEKITYFALAGGVNVNFSFLNFDELNNHLISNFNVNKNFEGNLLQIGGEGFTGLIYLNNFRLTVGSYVGSKNLEYDITSNSNSYKRIIDFKTSFTGISIDYAIVPFKKFAILPGLAFGRGNLTINAYQNRDKFDWNQFKPGNSEQEIWRHELSNNFWVIKPQLNLEYALTNFLMFRIGVGYNTSFGTNWEYNNSAEVTNIPDKINSNGLTLQTGIFLGLFNY